MRPLSTVAQKRLASLAWVTGAIAVVVLSVLAMRQGADSRLARSEPADLRAATATLKTGEDDRPGPGSR